MSLGPAEIVHDALRRIADGDTDFKRRIDNFGRPSGEDLLSRRDITHYIIFRSGLVEHAACHGDKAVDLLRDKCGAVKV